MKNCAVICEYNPFHTGHKYQLDCIRNYSVDNIFCIMSGNFVQSGMPAFCKKDIRAECAILGGADAVIELPTVFCTASAQYFAEGAVKIVNDIKNIAYLAMGAVASRDEIMRISDIKIKHSDTYSDELKKELQSGKSYNASSISALSRLCNKIHPGGVSENIFTDPNNILCIEYIYALNKLSSNAEPIIIKRIGSAYNDTSTYGEYVSATAIRNAEINGNLICMKKYIPYCYEKITEQLIDHSPDITTLKSMAVYALKCAETQNIYKLRNCSEGMEHLFKKLSKFSKYDDYIDTVVGKRYGKKRIDRFFLDLLLDIDKTMLGKNFITRLLACNTRFDFKLLPQSVKTTNAEIKNCSKYDNDVHSILEVDIKATALYNTLCKINGDYFNYSVIKL